MAVSRGTKQETQYQEDSINTGLIQWERDGSKVIPDSCNSWRHLSNHSKFKGLLRDGQKPSQEPMEFGG